MTTPAGRVVGVVRLSRYTDASTSPTRQREIIQQWASLHEYTIVGWADDQGVSAAVSPWDRPQLGAWLRGEREPFDALVMWRLDRLTRRVLHFASLLDWAKDNGKKIASATEGFDLSTPLGRMVAQMVSMLAEGELEAIRERTKASYDHLVLTGRHRGGFTPYGYRPVASPGGGYRLEIDPEPAAVIGEMARRFIAGESINSVVTWLNHRQIPTSLDLQRIRAGKPAKGCAWRVGNLTKLLRSRTLLGHLQPDNGQPVVDSDGYEVRRAEPVLSQKQWDQLQQTITARRTRAATPHHRTNAAMLLRVAHCGICGQRMYTYPGRAEQYYRCASKTIGGRSCGNKSVRASMLEQITADLFLARVGDIEVTRRVYQPGEDHTDDITRTEQAIHHLVTRIEKIPTGGSAETAILTRIRHHEEHLTALRGKPIRPARWFDEPTGETFRRLWNRLDDQDRGRLLRDSGVHITWTSTRTHIDLGNLEQLAQRAKNSTAVANDMNRINLTVAG
jgi:site-specific DNA recombinase